MNKEKTWWQIIRLKLLVSTIMSASLWVGSGQLGFPLIFQAMFAGYVFFGFIVFVLLDAPPLKAFSGWKAGTAILGFYLVCSALYITAGTFLPQFSSETEMEGIDRKTVKYREDPAVTESLRHRSRELSEKADEILARLEQLKASGEKLDIESVEVAGFSPKLPPSRDVSGLDIVERGKLVYKDHECYNCHKIGGKGGKKRGPELDNMGNLATAEQLKKKIFEPTAWYAEGYEKRKKDKMPDKFPDVMSEEELEALVAYLMTLKNPAVKTPKPVFPSGS
ncbi:MAG: cytochrome c [Nitrospirota bacterium]